MMHAIQPQQLTHMQPQEAAQAAALEAAVSAHPWSARHYADAIEAGYRCYVLRSASMTTVPVAQADEHWIGHFVLMIAADAAELLNFVITQPWQGQGYGRALLKIVCTRALEQQARMLHLEVRESNVSALRLYENAGFQRSGRRRGYYPLERLAQSSPDASKTREDAVLMQLELFAG